MCRILSNIVNNKNSGKFLLEIIVKYKKLRLILNNYYGIINLQQTQINNLRIK